jgi:FtsZ-binding cell division protein ZapB
VKKRNDENESLPLNGTEDAEILARLSERVERAVALIQELRRERDELRARVTELETRVQDVGSLEEETERFRRERGEVRDRIETILASLEALEGE